jgi:hypothetical protein
MEGGLSAEAAKRAFARYVEFNNRLGHRQVPLPEERPTDPATAAPPASTPQAAPQAPPAPVQEITPELIQDHALQLASTDPECVSLDREAEEPKAERKALLERHPNLDDDIRFYDRAARDVAEEDPVLAEKYRERLAELKAARNDLAGLNARIRDLKERFDSRFSQHYRRVTDHFAQQKAQSDAAAASQAAINRHVEELTQAWPVAEEAAMKAHGLDPSLLGELRERATDAALANLSRGIKVTDVYAFVAGHAKAIKDRMVEFHRLQAVEHGRLAHVRTDQVTPPPGVAPGVQTKASDSESTAGLSVQEIRARARLDARNRVLGR